MREIELDQSELSEAESALIQLASVFFPSETASPTGADAEPDMPLAEARYRMLLDQMTAVVFMVALAWGAWCSRQEPSPRRAARSARPSRSENDGELAPIRIGR